MSELQKTYSEIIVALHSPEGKKLTFEKAIEDKSSRLGQAGVAITTSVLDDGKIHVQHLNKRIPEFSQTEIKTALSNLRRAKFFVYDRKKKGYMLSIGEDEKIEDIIFWALLGAVAQGWINRK